MSRKKMILALILRGYYPLQWGATAPCITLDGYNALMPSSRRVSWVGAPAGDHTADWAVLGLRSIKILYSYVQQEE